VEGKIILGTILRRRSVREFRDKTVDKRIISDILEAGRWAPSGLNNQPWRFLIIRNKVKKDALSRFTKYGRIIQSAPVAIAVCMDMADSYNRDKDLMAIGACIQNMLLVASAFGLGSCWLGEILNRRQEAEDFIKLDSNLELAAVIALGYPKEKISKGRRKPLKSLVLKEK